MLLCWRWTTSLCSSEASLARWVSGVSGRMEYRETEASFFPSSLYFDWNSYTVQQGDEGACHPGYQATAMCCVCVLRPQISQRWCSWNEWVRLREQTCSGLSSSQSPPYISPAGRGRCQCVLSERYFVCKLNFCCTPAPSPGGVLVVLQSLRLTKQQTVISQISGVDHTARILLNIKSSTYHITYIYI